MRRRCACISNPWARFDSCLVDNPLLFPRLCPLRLDGPSERLPRRRRQEMEAGPTAGVNERQSWNTWPAGVRYTATDIVTLFSSSRPGTHHPV